MAEQDNYIRIPLEQLAPGDEVRQAGQWVEIESAKLDPRGVWIRLNWRGGGSHTYPISHGVTARRFDPPRRVLITERRGDVETSHEEILRGHAAYKLTSICNRTAYEHRATDVLVVYVDAAPDPCTCDHCREAGTCLGCTSGVCP